MAIREGAWDCPQCGRRRNRGPDKHCGGCGYPRGSDVRFYLPDDAQEVTDAAALAHARSGPDWTCTYCDGDNPADADFCTGCGASKEGAPPRPVIEHRDAPAAPTPAAADGGAKDVQARKGKKRGCGRTLLGLGCLGLSVVALLAILGGWWSSRERVAEVTGFHWSRTIEVERRSPETREAWEGEVPSDARVLDTRREVHHRERTRIGTEDKVHTRTERVQVGTEKVKVGTRDLGNGYFEDVYEDRPVYEEVEHRETRAEPVYREDPVYRNKVRFEMEVWKTARTEKAGADDRSPNWPSVSLSPGEREGKRTEAYVVEFRDEKGRVRLYTATSEDEWRGFEPGGRYRVKPRGSREIDEVLGPAMLEKSGGS